MIRDESRSDNGCPGYIKHVTPDGRLAVQIYEIFNEAADNL